MIYLIAQILVALTLAGLLGAAVGWLIHRASHARQLQDYRRALAQAHNQAAQTESEVAMLADDYDELQRRSRAEIDTLRSENQQIPFLNTNLEKSQLLVRQMMQRHEAKVRDLSSENQTLSAKLKSIRNREMAYNKVKAELDSIRLQKTAGNGELTHSAVASPSDEETNQDPDDHHPDTSNGSSELDDSLSNSLLDNAQLDKSQLNLDSTSEEEAVELLDATIVSSPAETLINSLNASSVSQNTTNRSGSSWASAPIEISADRSPHDDSDDYSLRHQKLDASFTDNNDLSAENTRATLDEQSSDAITDDANIESSAEIAATTDGGDDPFDEVMEFGDELQHELDISADDAHSNDPLLDGSSDRASLFEPVEQRDDLKQIFGIGPVTEKALNELGITSYSQLAELKSHEIEKIAGALEIVPGRIERDDWVGNARRQLEDVLEEL